MEYPVVIWMGKQPLRQDSARRFRLVYRGPARPGRPDDVPFAVEQRIGQSMMKRLNWDGPKSETAMKEAIYALGHALGQILMKTPLELCMTHPIHCEENMALIEGRESRGCDCHGPAEPEERP